MARSGLLFLRDSVAQYFESLGITAAVKPVGLKYRSFNDRPGRVVFIPGQFDGSNDLRPRPYGELSRQVKSHSQFQGDGFWDGSSDPNFDPLNPVPVTQPVDSINPRELFQWDKAITISVWAASTSRERQDDQSQYDNTEDLFELVLQGCQQAIGADFVPRQLFRVSPPEESSYGEEILLWARTRGPLFDATAGTAAISQFLLSKTDITIE